MRGRPFGGVLFAFGERDHVRVAVRQPIRDALDQRYLVKVTEDFYRQRCGVAA